MKWADFIKEVRENSRGNHTMLVSPSTLEWIEEQFINEYSNPFRGNLYGLEVVVANSVLDDRVTIVGSELYELLLDGEDS